MAKAAKQKETPLKVDMSFEQLLSLAANGNGKTKVVTPRKGGFQIIYNPETKIWHELIGYDEHGNEVWQLIP
jgi:hypothetical protein